MSQTMMFGPQHGELRLFTGVGGKAARLGHALTIVVAAWECRTELEGETVTAVELTAQLPSLQVVSGTGGVKPLSDKDKRTIKSSALKTLSADRHPEVRFVATVIEPGWTLTGDLALHGTTHPLTIAVEVSGAKVVAQTAVLQSAWGITPHSQMLGALQVEDEVSIELAVEIPGA